MIFTSYYKGFDGKVFLFETKKGHQTKLFPSEINPLDMSLETIISVMSLYKNDLFKIMLFWDNRDYYVEKINDKYHLFDATNNELLDVSYPDFNSIPATYHDKRIQKYKQKRVIGHFKNRDNVKTDNFELDNLSDDIPF